MNIDIKDEDVSVDENGNIRWTGKSRNRYYSVLDLHLFLQGKHKGASERKTDHIIFLNGHYNVDEVMAAHLKDGAIFQDDCNTIYGTLGF